MGQRQDGAEGINFSPEQLGPTTEQGQAGLGNRKKNKADV